MGQILQRMGYCRTGHVVVATRDDLVGQYVGHTAPKTKEMVKKAMGGILLVDEAYYLYNAANDRDYGQESIEILLNVMENNKEDIIIVLAGYKDRMDSFYDNIPVTTRTAPLLFSSLSLPYHTPSNLHASLSTSILYSPHCACSTHSPHCACTPTTHICVRAHMRPSVPHIRG